MNQMTTRSISKMVEKSLTEKSLTENLLTENLLTEKEPKIRWMRPFAHIHPLNWKGYYESDCDDNDSSSDYEEEEEEDHVIFTKTEIQPEKELKNLEKIEEQVYINTVKIILVEVSENTQPNTIERLEKIIEMYIYLNDTFEWFKNSSISKNIKYITALQTKAVEINREIVNNVTIDKNSNSSELIAAYYKLFFQSSTLQEKMKIYNPV
jgi:hypothetical protein